MYSSEFDWRGGRVTYWDLECVSASEVLEGDRDCLKEDLAQAEFGSNYVLDVGWFAMGRDRGAFVVVVVRDDAWDAPLFRVECEDLPALRDAIREGILAAMSLSSAAP